MLFNSFEFLFTFLPIALTLYYFIGRYHHAGAIAWLALVSVFFYAYWSLYSLPVLMLSIIANYFFGEQLQKRHGGIKRILLIFSISLNLLALAYYKYANFFIDNANFLLNHFGLESWDSLNVILPIGISFFTFTQIAYLLDIYLGKVQKVSFSNYILFVTFFPHLIAGPIIHHKQVMPQFSNANLFKIDYEKITLGLIIFVLGMAKKLLIADPLGGYVDKIFGGISKGNLPQFIDSWCGSFAYTFQLYFDFSGYSDMAVGLSLLFGILLPFNFHSPFKAHSIIDFWQRWHISLTKYIGEYLYTPITLFFMRLGQSQSPAVETLLSLVFPTIFIFLILGIWHGANWTFVVFGGMHGIFIVVNHLWRKLPKLPTLDENSRLKITFYWLSTFFAVNIAFVMFRSASIGEALAFYRGMIGLNGEGSVNATQGTFIFLIAALSISLFCPSTIDMMNGKFQRLLSLDSGKSPWRLVMFSSMIGVLGLLCVLRLSHPSTFLYFQF